MNFMENFPSLDPFKRSLSSLKGLIFFLWIEERNLSTSLVSQSLKDLKKVGDYPPSSLSQSHKSATIASFCTARIYREGNKKRSASSPHQTSFQKLIILLSPKEKAAFWRKRGHSFLISFHNLAPNPPLMSQLCQPNSWFYLFGVGS